MIVSLALFGREIFVFEIGRRFLVDSSQELVRLGANVELSEDEDPGVPFGFSPS